MNFGSPIRGDRPESRASLPALRPSRPPSQDDMDPLAAHSPHKSSYSAAHHGAVAATPPPKPRFSVVMAPSPGNLSQYRDVDLEERDDLEEGEEEPVVVSDLRRRGGGGSRKEVVAGHAMAGMTGASFGGGAGTQITVQLPQRSAAANHQQQYGQQYGQQHDHHHQSGSSMGASAPQAKTRGRPKGWKPGMTYAEVRGTTPTAATGMGTGRPGRPPKPKTAEQLAAAAAVKKRGRPPKQPSPPPVEIFRRLRPDFQVFGCEWEGCRAELHNLGTLRKHVGVVHVRRQRGDEGGGKRCRWAGCDRQGAGFGGDKDDGDYRGDADEELRRHVDEEHLVAFEWHMGDGPNNTCAVGSRAREEGSKGSGGGGGDADGGGDGDGVPAYLKDAEGNQVTPSIRDQEMEDLLTWKANRRRLKELLLRRDANLPSDDEDTAPEEEDIVM